MHCGRDGQVPHMVFGIIQLRRFQRHVLTSRAKATGSSVAILPRSARNAPSRGIAKSESRSGVLPIGPKRVGKTMKEKASLLSREQNSSKKSQIWFQQHQNHTLQAGKRHSQLAHLANKTPP